MNENGITTVSVLSAKSQPDSLNPLGQFSRAELVTPQRAEELLGKQINPRPIRQARVAQYSESLQGQEWLLHHQGIAIDIHGHLRDGQHRLEAIRQTGIAAILWVTYNVDPRACLHIDEQMPRTLRVALRAAEKGNFGTSLIAVARLFLTMPSTDHNKQPRTPEKILHVLHTYGEALAFAEDHLRGKGLTRGTRVLVARAWYHVNEDRLAEWCQVLTTGLSVSENARHDDAAMAYRRNVIDANMGHTGMPLEAERYCKGQTALQYFLLRQSVTKIYGTPDDLFPVPSSSPNGAPRQRPAPKS